MYISSTAEGPRNPILALHTCALPQDFGGKRLHGMRNPCSGHRSIYPIRHRCDKGCSFISSPQSSNSPCQFRRGSTPCKDGRTASSNLRVQRFGQAGRSGIMYITCYGGFSSGIYKIPTMSSEARRGDILPPSYVPWQASSEYHHRRRTQAYGQLIMQATSE
jgi:hypothetical protein